MRTNECQDADVRDASRAISKPVVLVMRVREQWRTQCSWSTLKRVADFLGRRFRAQAAPICRTPWLPAEVLALRPGEWIEVKSEQEIRKTLDRDEKYRGLGFMPGMSAYCGKRLRVYKCANTIILEGSGDVRKLSNTVLLDGAICDGENLVCDRSCFYFWKEAWLKRVSSEEGRTVNECSGNDRAGDSGR